MIAVWVPGAALSAVHRTKTAIMTSHRRQPTPTDAPGASRKPTSGGQQPPSGRATPIAVSVPPTALSAAHGTENDDHDASGESNQPGFRLPRSPRCACVVTGGHQNEGQLGGTGTAGHVVGAHAVKIAENVSSPCSVGHQGACWLHTFGDHGRRGAGNGRRPAARALIPHGPTACRAAMIMNAPPPAGRYRSFGATPSSKGAALLRKPRLRRGHRSAAGTWASHSHAPAAGAGSAKCGTCRTAYATA